MKAETPTLMLDSKCEQTASSLIGGKTVDMRNVWVSLAKLISTTVYWQVSEMLLSFNTAAGHIKENEVGHALTLIQPKLGTRKIDREKWERPA